MAEMTREQLASWARNRAPKKKTSVPRSSNTGAPQSYRPPTGTVGAQGTERGLGGKNGTNRGKGVTGLGRAGWTSTVPDWESKTTNGKDGLGGPSGARSYSVFDSAGPQLDAFERMIAGLDQPDTPPSGPSGGSGGSGRGGGGGGGVSQSAALDAQSEGLAALLGSGAFNERDITADLARLSGAEALDQDAARSAGDAQARFINSQGNAYGQPSLSTAKKLDPDMAALLSALGGDAGAYKAEIGLQEVLADQGFQADERFRRTMASSEKVRQNDALLAASQGTDYAASELAASGTASREALRTQKRAEDKATRDRQMQIVLQLIESNAARGQSTDVGQYFGGA